MQYGRFKKFIKYFFCLPLVLIACSESPKKSNGNQKTEPSEVSETTTLPPKVVELKPFTQQTSLSAGESYVCFKRFDQKLKCWGDNKYGQLGIGDTQNRGDQSNEMGGNLEALLDKIQIFATGANHACSLLENGSVKCWGKNTYGQLGLENEQNQKTPNLAKISNVKALTAGKDHTCALLENGSVKCWGDNKYGQLGMEGVTDRGTKLDEMGAFLTALTFEKPVLQVAAGFNHTCVLLQNSNVQCWGDNQYGKLGIGESTNLGIIQGSMKQLQNVQLGQERHATFLAAGKNHTCVILDNGNAKCWGKNDSGQLGLGNTTDRGLRASDMGESLSEIQFGQKIKQLAVGGNHTCALLEDGTVKCWGKNDSGQLGLGNTQNRGDQPKEQSNTFQSAPLKRKAIAITAGYAFNCVLLEDDTIQCWGKNDSGQLGLGDTQNRGDQPNEMAQNLLTVELEGSHTIKQGDAVVGISKHTCSVLDNGKVKCWGDNTHGQLGLGDTQNRGGQLNEMGARLPYLQLGTTAKSVVVGKDFTCAILANGQVKCWGDNTHGQLGIDSSQTSFGKTLDDMGDALPAVSLKSNATQLALGESFACALLDDKNIKCWGKNTYGQLGLGDRQSRGDDRFPISDTPVDLGTGRTAKAISTGALHACAILDDDTVKCWGRNLHGQLGYGSTTEYGSTPNMGDTLPTVNLGTGHTAKVISLGNFHSCVILDDDTVKCWGKNDSGQLGLGDANSRGKNTGQMGNDLPVVSLGTGRTAKAISTGTSHACAILDDDTVKCWGKNDSGQLGLGDTQNRGDQAREMGDALPTVDLGTGRTAKNINAGHSNTCVVLDDDTLKCWGDNAHGQLGLGDTQNRGDQPNEMSELESIAL